MLDRYVARLVSLKRMRDALALYRREIDRNPNDPGLYDTLAAFLEQNELGAEIEPVYQRAIAQFQDHTWEHKLARWYLRREAAGRCGAADARRGEDFFGDGARGVFPRNRASCGPVGPALYLQLNLYAHQRFPHHLSFVRNLLTAYVRRRLATMSAYEALLRQHWYYAEDLRHAIFRAAFANGEA